MLGEATHLVQICLLGHVLSIVDEVGAKEYGDRQPGHGHGLGSCKCINSFYVQQDCGKLLTL